MRVALFTDTLGDINGVSRFVRTIAAIADRRGLALQVLTSTRLATPQRPNIANLAPVAARTMPGYPDLQIVLPPVRALLRAAALARPDVIHVSTPGPVGLVGMLAARRLRVPLVAVYHTDFPAYVDHLFDDAALTWGARTTMRSLYTRFSRVLARSRDGARHVGALGIAPSRIVTLAPGVDLSVFHPGARDPGIWTRLGLGASGAARALCVGRISVEKNLALLALAWREASARLEQLGRPHDLIVVGDGPYRTRLEQQLAGTRATFLGFRQGPELSALYASSDLFVFPSATDTLGQVVMEAQASGLPALVSDVGGPREIVRDRATGFVLPANRPRAWADAIVDLMTDSDRRVAMGAAAHAAMRELSIERSFDQFWRVHQDVRDARSH